MYETIRKRNTFYENSMAGFYEKILGLLLGERYTHYSYDQLSNCLETNFEDCNRKKVKHHIDYCSDCWHLWNKARWDIALNTQGILELRDYLGDDFVEYYDSSLALAEEWISKEPETKREVNHFYKENRNYLYNLIVWYESGDRPNFASEIEKISDVHKFSSFIDFGCGVGNDGLYLIEKGYDVTFVDFECPSIEFLKWRGIQRGHGIKFLDIESIQMFPSSEVFFAIDVLEHVLDPLDIIDRIHANTKMFIHHSEFNNMAGGRHPFHFNFDIRQLNARLIDAGFKEVKNHLFSVWIRN